uniref:50S ribosomal protein L20 n=1 Tax=Lotharella vacuolata TaxID=74820 RepID=A0A140JZU9_9EUKA|nr:50S ribosomal protein L20 [Lotharella vacuolata]BAU62626.1 50S ribosomal protein L20 [Lotharella vacuolata]
MTRIKRGKITVRNRKKLNYQTNGFRGAWSTLSRTMLQIRLKSLNFSYIHRKKKFNSSRKFYILRSNAAFRGLGLPCTYNFFIFQLCKSQCKLNRNILTQLCIRDDTSFLTVVKFCFFFFKSKEIN